MLSKRLSVTVTRRLPDAVETRMRELFDVTLRTDDTPDDTSRAGCGHENLRCAGADCHG